MDIDRQFEQLSWGCDTVISEEELKRKLRDSGESGKPLKVKLGVDPTAPDIHLGHTVVLRKLRQFQDLGHEAILLIGGFTSQIGDPSGKSKTRPPLSEEEILVNAKTYLDQVYKILRPERLRVVNNKEWLDGMSLKETFRLLSHATMSKLLEHNTFRERFESEGSIRVHEFLYPFLQGYDSVVLEADVELGGTDQLFNIGFGRELMVAYGQIPQCAMLMPILTGTDGKQKMSKSLGNYIGVTESPLVMRQKVLNMPDVNIVSYLKLLTGLSPEEVLKMESVFKGNPDTEVILKYKHLLVDELISVFHPESSKDGVGELVVSLSDCENGRLGVVKALVLAEFAKSNREASTFVSSGAVRVDGERVVDRAFELDLSKGPVVLNVGKKKFVRLRFGE